MTASAIDEAKALADEMLARKTSRLRFIDYISPTWKQFRTLERLRESSLADVLVPSGETLGMLDLGADGEAYYGKVDEVVSDESLDLTSARAWGWNFPSHPEYPDAATWSRKIEVRFQYGRAGWDVGISFSGNDHAITNGANVSRDKWHSNYVETGYEGHDQMYREATATEVRLLTDLVAEIVHAGANVWRG